MTSTDKTKGPIVKVDLHCEDINVEFLHLTETLMEYFLEESAPLILFKEKFHFRHKLNAKPPFMYSIK